MAIEEIKRVVTDAINASNYSDPEQLAEAVTRELSRQLGGTRLYIPACADRAERDAAIRSEFNGRNMATVCARYGIKPRRVYQIMNENTQDGPP